MAKSGRIPHALMFLGTPGSGDLALALAFSQYVLCEHSGSDESCGTCANCLKASKCVHPDLHFSFPTVGANVTSDACLPDWRAALAENPYLDVNQWLQRIGTENKQGNITKEECVNIIRKLSLKTFEGCYKILLMWLPEYLGKEGNRLLKMIEEPPEGTLLLLVAQNQDLILNTIISRCQLVKVNRLRDDEVEQGLISLKNMSLEKAHSVARLANGDFNEALKIADQPMKDNAALFLDWMRKCYLGNGPDMVNWCDQFAGLGRENQKHFFQYGLHFMREYMMLKTTGNAEVSLLPEELKTAQNLVKIIGFTQIERITELFTDCVYFIERNANQKLLFLDTSIQLNKILRS
jgi:DNA polymerase-3 subunit delta'